MELLELDDFRSSVVPAPAVPDPSGLVVDVVPALAPDARLSVLTVPLADPLAEPEAVAPPVFPDALSERVVGEVGVPVMPPERWVSVERVVDDE